MFCIDPTLGRHAGLALTDDELAYLLQVLHFELALRSDLDAYQQTLDLAMRDRIEQDEAVETARHERDLMAFARSVMDDLSRLQVSQPPTTNGAL